MSQLDERPTFTHTKSGVTRDICKAQLIVITEPPVKRVILKDGEDLDSVAQHRYGDQHDWKRIANASQNLKNILEWGIDFPVVKEIVLL